jgi:hypothetical protein
MRSFVAGLAAALFPAELQPATVMEETLDDLKRKRRAGGR